MMAKRWAAGPLHQLLERHLSFVPVALNGTSYSGSGMLHDVFCKEMPDAKERLH